jgi:hypothetical protein
VSDSECKSGPTQRMLGYVRFHSGNAFQSDFCAIIVFSHDVLLFPADNGSPSQLYGGRLRMKMYFRSWGRHQRFATLPRARVPLVEIDAGQYFYNVLRNLKHSGNNMYHLL